MLFSNFDSCASFKTHNYFTMKNYLFAAAVALSTTMISCGSNDKVDAIDESLGKPSTETTAPANAADVDPLANTPDLIIPDSMITNPKFLEKMEPATPPVAKQQQTVASGLNPEHGQPGHRCDIAVGAPLNSAPAAKTTTPAPAPTITPTLTPTVTPAATPASTTPAPAGAKLNPAHGQPGHDCTIPVGAPLKG